MKDFDRERIEHVFQVADIMEHIAKGDKKSKILEGKTLLTLFFEPSTRTKLSFESAVLKLGGGYTGFANTMASSVAKGESLEDTIRVVENYGDIIVIRHSKEGSAKKAADLAKIPIINAGDGTNEHPTQALLDLYTIKREKGRIDGSKVVLIGDLLHSRSMKSMVYGLANFDVEAVLVSPKGLRMPKPVLQELKRIYKFNPTYSDDIRSVIRDADVLRIVRVLKERFSSQEEYKRMKSSYVVDLPLLELAKKNMIIIHPLPRLDELSVKVDKTPHAVYFRQVFYGLCIRMALLSLILGAVS